ncbi:hypothetical protein GUITHDRAFT_118960 [Guillardia theta CCMP2712]|uniref:TNFR-Cys domain-containing protein n=1 Tax=Guillardia theta (strain CCMP2712) TaxID=905079 RepID=L1IF87_GUITC|nr:hypothetical protein GUITHDRAFT_118960 [Guillardia theta CCMP2712]EKX34916.1 hypothetical protein GUITHDRAFT_118960 [Guillardia theta CCMP2712]|eukprot:XP_005821896.1 hypothetical protein GUITHDRAFT_118960 [Guillardia theta CCMP2712]
MLGTSLTNLYSVNPSSRYDVSLCDVVDGGLDVFWDGGTLYHRRMLKPVWLYVAISAVSVYLVSVIAQNITALLLGEPASGGTASEGGRWAWAVRAAEVTVVGGVLGCSVLPLLVNDSLLLWDELAYAWFMLAYVALHAAFMAYKVRFDRDNRARHFLTFNLITGILLLLTLSIYNTLANPYVGILLVMLAMRCFYKVLDVSLAERGACLDLEAAVMVFDAAGMLLTHYVGFRRSFMFGFDGDTSFVIVCLFSWGCLGGHQFSRFCSASDASCFGCIANSFENQEYISDVTGVIYFCECNSGAYFDSSSGVACRVCSCPPNMYASTPCQDAAAPVCSDCTSCFPGFYASSQCSYSSNTGCTACKDCAPENYLSGGCTGPDDSACTAFRKCGANEYETNGCNEQLKDRECATCPGCPIPGQFRVNCGGKYSGDCTYCTQRCISITTVNRYTPDCQSTTCRQAEPYCSLQSEYVFLTAFSNFDRECLGMDSYMQQYNYIEQDTLIMNWVEDIQCMLPFISSCVRQRVEDRVMVVNGMTFSRCSCKAGYRVQMYSVDEVDLACLKSEFPPVVTEIDGQDVSVIPYYFCKRCPPMTYSEASDIGCKTCPLGSSPNADQTSCEPCALGTINVWSIEMNAYVCLPCEPGTYQNERNQYQCKPCGWDQYSGYGETSCHFCLGPANHTSDHVKCALVCQGRCEYWNSTTQSTDYVGLSGRTRVCPDLSPSSTCVACDSVACATDSLRVFDAASYTDKNMNCSMCSGVFLSADYDCEEGVFIMDTATSLYGCRPCQALPFQMCPLEFVQRYNFHGAMVRFTRVGCTTFVRGVPDNVPNYGRCVDCKMALSQLPNSSSPACGLSEYMDGCGCQNPSALNDSDCVVSPSCAPCFANPPSNAVVSFNDMDVSCQLDCLPGYTGISVNDVCVDTCILVSCDGTSVAIPCLPPLLQRCERCVNVYNRQDSLYRLGTYDHGMNFIDRRYGQRMASFENLMIMDVTRVDNRLCVRGNKYVDELTGEGASSYSDQDGFKFPVQCFWDETDDTHKLAYRDSLPSMQLENKFAPKGSPQWYSDSITYAEIHNPKVSGLGETYIRMKLFSNPKTLHLPDLKVYPTVTLERSCGLDQMQLCAFSSTYVDPTNSNVSDLFDGDPSTGYRTINVALQDTLLFDLGAARGRQGKGGK